MEPSTKVQILLIDETKEIAKEFAQELESQANGLEFGIEICQNVNAFEGFTYDLYVCAQRVPNIEDCIQTIKAIKKKNPRATIFIASSFHDYSFIKPLLKLNVAGLIDKDSIDVSSILEEAQGIAETRIKINKLVQKMNTLEDRKESVKENK